MQGSTPEPAQTQQSQPGRFADPSGGIAATAVYFVRELGMTAALVAFVCYLLAIQLPGMQRDFRAQTDKLTEAIAAQNTAVNNNSRVMQELISEVKAMRRERGDR
jgi:hypothetical protein